LSGYSALDEPILPRSLSKMDTRTLSVPKSTPATMLMRCILYGYVPVEKPSLRIVAQRQTPA
jgi:hypothetical protein